jgi:hypothetical protein
MGLQVLFDQDSSGIKSMASIRNSEAKGATKKPFSSTSRVQKGSKKKSALAGWRTKHGIE